MRMIAAASVSLFSAVLYQIVINFPEQKITLSTFFEDASVSPRSQKNATP
jgi:hypothetical protein